MVTEQVYVSNVWQSLVLSLAFASVVILVATQNIVLTIFAVVAIACTVTSVLGLVNLFGWRIGIAESIATDFFVGFSVDYVVHAVHQYSHSHQNSRLDRVKSIYQNIGVAVFSGAATTFIAVTFLLFTRIYVLLKFGVLM
jgi:predicted RND superfamily exporter protein